MKSVVFLSFILFAKTNDKCQIIIVISPFLKNYDKYLLIVSIKDRGIYFADMIKGVVHLMASAIPRLILN